LLLYTNHLSDHTWTMELPELRDLPYERDLKNSTFLSVLPRIYHVIGRCLLCHYQPFLCQIIIISY